MPTGGHGRTQKKPVTTIAFPHQKKSHYQTSRESNPGSLEQEASGLISRLATPLDLKYKMDEIFNKECNKTEWQNFSVEFLKSNTTEKPNTILVTNLYFLHKKIFCRKFVLLIYSKSIRFVTLLSTHIDRETNKE